MEIDISSQLEELVDNVNELKDWGERKEPCKPIVLKMRANCGADIRIVQLRIPFYDWEEDIPEYNSSTVEGVVTVVTADFNQKIGRRTPSPQVVWNTYTNGSISLLKSKLIDQIVKKQIDGSRESIRQRLHDFGEAIPVSSLGQTKFISALFARYKDAVDKALLDVGTAISDLTISSDQCRWIEHSLERIQEILESVASNTFIRFPTITGELRKVISVVLSDFVRPRLEMIASNFHQTHFLLLHEFECDTGNCSGQCAYVLLFRATITQLMESVRSSLFTIVANKLPSWVCFLHEPCSTKLEREQLKRKLKVMHKLYALL